MLLFRLCENPAAGCLYCGPVKLHISEKTVLDLELPYITSTSDSNRDLCGHEHMKLALCRAQQGQA